MRIVFAVFPKLELNHLTWKSSKGVRNVTLFLFYGFPSLGLIPLICEKCLVIMCHAPFKSHVPKIVNYSALFITYKFFGLRHVIRHEITVAVDRYSR